MRVLAQFAALLETLFVLTHCQFDIRKPPKIIYPNHSATYFYPFGLDVVLKCKADGIPSPTYKWLHNGEDIIPNEYLTYDSMTGDLTITYFSRREEGTYVCAASNLFDNEKGGRVKATSLSPPITLYQTRLQRFISAPDTSTTVTEFSYVKLACSNQGEVIADDKKYMWYTEADNEEILELSLDGDRLFIDQDGDLHFAYVLRQDSSGSSMKYRCSYSSVAEGIIVLGNSISLNVEPVNNPAPVKPQLEYSNSGQKVTISSQARLECVFSGYDPIESHLPAIHWYDDVGTELTTGGRYKFSRDKRVLIINSVVEEDEKNYYCQAEDSAGKITGSPVFLNVTSAPIFRLPNGAPKDMVMPEEEDVIFHCDARSALSEQEPEKPTWYINGQKFGFHLAPTKYILSGDKKTLTIKHVKKAFDILCVQCEVSNSVGTTGADACLNVILPIKLIRIPALQQMVQKGDIVDLSVSAVTDPSQTLSYKWEFNGLEYTRQFDFPPYVSYDLDTDSTFINTSLLTQEEYETINGTYTRTIFHPYEERSVEIHVILTEPEPESANTTHIQASFTNCLNSLGFCSLMYADVLESSQNNTDTICIATQRFLKCVIDDCGIWGVERMIERTKEYVDVLYPEANCATVL